MVGWHVLAFAKRAISKINGGREQQPGSAQDNEVRIWDHLMVCGWTYVDPVSCNRGVVEESSVFGVNDVSEELSLQLLVALKGQATLDAILIAKWYADLGQFSSRSIVFNHMPLRD